MRKLGLLFLAAVWIAIAPESARADVEPVDYAFLLSAQVTVSPPSVTIRWPQKSVPAIFVRRKFPGDTDWGGTVTLAGNATSYVDTGVQSGKVYEYEFQ